MGSPKLRPHLVTARARVRVGGGVGARVRVGGGVVVGVRVRVTAIPYNPNLAHGIPTIPTLTVTLSRRPHSFCSA